MSQNPLDKVRKKIDHVDDKILSLLNERAQLAKDVGKIKAKQGEKVFASDRESAILNRVLEKNPGQMPNESVQDIFQTIITASRSLQKNLKVAFFGPEATFTHQAAIRHFGRNVDFIAVPTIRDVFFEVERNRADYGVVPIENSTEGVVNHTLDMFQESKLHIVAERAEPISHALLSISGKIKDIKTVYSFPHAIAQCRKWLDAHLPRVTIHEAASTADAAVQATLDSSCAAIASELAGRMYNLKPVALKIEDTTDNATRFLVIGHEISKSSGRDKTSVMFSIKDHVGALHEMLLPFEAANINLTKIESRPTKKKAWDYVFFVDFIGHQSDKNVQSALNDLRERCTSLKVLGSYPYGA